MGHILHHTLCTPRSTLGANILHQEVVGYYLETNLTTVTSIGRAQEVRRVIKRAESKLLCHRKEHSLTGQGKIGRPSPSFG